MIEKVIKRLEYCAENKCDICQEENGSGFPWIDGRCYGFTERLYDALALPKTQEHEALDMPKPDSDIGCWYNITHNYTLEQVVNALKAQEPRVMTLEEYKTWIDTPFTERNPVFHEERTKRGTVTSWVNTTVCSLREYGKNDRCWTSRPDEKTREETPWN